MPPIAIFLRAAAFVFFLVAALHLVLGLKSDVLLGALVPESVLHDPVLDSQNRFYGTSFSLYGVLLLISAGNLEKYVTVLRGTLWCFFAAGLARLVSIFMYGAPSTAVVSLLLSELLLPPLILWWLQHTLKPK